MVLFRRMIGIRVWISRSSFGSPVMMVQVCNHSDGGDNSVLIDDRSKRSGQGSIGVSFGDAAKKLR